MKPAVIYSRVSSVSDRQNTERQVSDLNNYAKKNDFQVVKEFSENISGAKKNEERTVLMECIEFCVKNKVDTLLCSELSRIGRDTLQVLRSLDVLHSNKVNVYIQNLSLNTLNEQREINPIASIIVTVMAEMAKIERTNIVYRLNSGRQNYINAGGALGRSKGSTKSTETKKEEYKEVISLLKRNYSIRNTAKLTETSISTVQRVKKEFGL
jgi:DNA invertase Pin-like site-specific DNA recombinase